jgi:uncharacterized membrane protein YccF (DUF307 family)
VSANPNFNNINNNMNNIVINLGQTPGVTQRAWIVRALYYLLIGWWFTAIWVVVAYILALLIITIPLASKMFNNTNKVLTLAR